MQENAWASNSGLAEAKTELGNVPRFGQPPANDRGDGDGVGPMLPATACGKHFDGDRASGFNGGADPGREVKFAGTDVKDGGSIGTGAGEKVGECVLRDLAAELQSIVQGSRKMDAAIKAGLADFFGARVQAVIRARFPRQTVRRNRKGDLVAAVEARQNCRSGATERAVTRNILGKRGRV